MRTDGVDLGKSGMKKTVLSFSIGPVPYPKHGDSNPTLAANAFGI